MSAVYGQSPGSPPDNGTTEKSVKSCYAVIYTLKNRKWAVAGEGGWSECHLCLDTLDNSYRILAWTVKSQEVLMNCNVVAECSYKEKSKNFHSFTDENGDRYGLGFHKSDSGLKQAQQFLKSVTSVIKNCKSESGYIQTPQQKVKNHENSQSTSVVPPLGYQNSSDKSHLNNDSMIIKNGNSNSINNNTNNNNNVSNDVINENEESYYIDPNWKPDENGGYYDDDGYYYNDKGQLTGYYDEYGEYFEYTEADLKQFYQSNNSNIKGDLSRSDTKKFMLKQKSNSKRNMLKTKVVIPPPPDGSTNNNNSNNNSNNNNNNNFKIITSNVANNNGNHVNESKDDELNAKPLLSQSQTSEAQNENSTSSDLIMNNASYGKLKNSNNHIKPFNNSEYEYKQKQSIVTPDPKYHLQNRQYKSIPNIPIKTQLGSLKILPPKPGKLKNPGDKAIKNPNKVELKVRVLYDPATGSYTGLPQEWLQELNRQFGVSPKTLPGIKLDKYNAKVPKVLVTLASSIKSNNGWKQVGIFRLAPNATESTKKKNEINTNGKLVIDNNSKTDVNVYANLIKVWFRDLPQPILNCVDPTRVELVANPSQALDVINIMPEPQKSIFLWLCDMCVECSQYSKINKMNSQNLAIVIGPNLFNTTTFDNPMKAMTFSGKVVEFFKHAIELRKSLALQNGTYTEYNE